MGDGKGTVAIIQARLGSTRLPGKVLEDISGKPMLWHVVNRAQKAGSLDQVLIATTLSARDDAVESFCKSHGFACFRGSEDNVLERYYLAALSFNAKTVVRLTADCPLIDPAVVDIVVSSYLRESGSYDYASNTVERTYPRGLDTEAFSFRVLEKCHKEAKEKPEREHVTLYMYEHPEEFRVLCVKNSVDLSGFRWTVDEERDLELVRQIYGRLYKNGKIFGMDDVLALFKSEPSLSAINKDVMQKAVK